MYTTPPGKGCQIFLGTTYQNGKNIPIDYKIYKMTKTYTKWPRNVPKFSALRPSKNIKIEVFGMKIYHLATLRQDEPKIFAKKSFFAGAQTMQECLESMDLRSAIYLIETSSKQKAQNKSDARDRCYKTRFRPKNLQSFIIL
jgi:hypothetical protein